MKLKNYILILLAVVFLPLIFSCASAKIEYVYDDPFLSIPEFDGIAFSQQVDVKGDVFTPDKNGEYVVIFLSDYTKLAKFVLLVEAEKRKYENWQKKITTSPNFEF